MNLDFNVAPLVVIWEVSQACDLACIHCRASAQPSRNPFELSTEEGKQLIDEVKRMGSPVFVLTGGDPLKRPDIYELIEYAASIGVRPSLTPSATPLLTRDSIFKMKAAGLSRLAVSLDGSTPELHDSLRGVSGSYERTLESVRWAREAGLPVQINTTIHKRNIADLDSLIALMSEMGIVLWSVFFLIPTGRGQTTDLPTAEEFEQVFEKLYDTAGKVRFHIKTTEAQFWRRFMMQRGVEERHRIAFADPDAPKPPRRIAGKFAGSGNKQGVNDGKGFIFVSHMGEVFPSGFLPLHAGNVRKAPLSEIYQHAPLLVAMRDSSMLKGKCGRCEFRDICGGSRARAYALTGDVFGEETCCVYEPGSDPKLAEELSLPAFVG